MPAIPDAPLIVTMPDRRIVGPLQRYDLITRSAIPSQWESYTTSGIQAEGTVPGAWYGVCAAFGPDGAFDYLSGMESPAGSLPTGWSEIVLPAGRWARFVCPGHISTIHAAWEEIMRDWLCRPGLVGRDGPSAEYYPPAFDGQNGGFEIWLPVT